jgi:hypothetical protein
VSSATRPVHTSLVTGLYPFEHGIQGQQDGRIRQGAARLFGQCRLRGDRVGLFSEAPTIFTGLEFGAPVNALDGDAGMGTEQVSGWLRQAGSDNRCLFLHYWSAHTPYGARDGKAMGETAQLLRSGHLEQVQARYRSAVQDVFENKVAPLLEALDLGQWAVLLFGDHGESWTPDEFYHGSTVRNSVLRVPLYLHVPYSAGPVAGSGDVVSLIDLYATAAAILDLPREDDGFGIDLRHATVADLGRFRMAQIRPGRGMADDEHVVVEPEPDSATLLRWCVFDAEHRLHGENEDWRLEAQWTEEPIADNAVELAAPYLAAREAFYKQSKWCDRPANEPLSTAQEDDLRRRLRALGYL